ncbi:MAG: hypothetical protein QHH09_04175 [Microgenomates group bacterium]|nr:hypothetical protein [Microgenomates group bacterium]
MFLEKPSFEGHGIGSGLMMLTDPFIRRIINLNHWEEIPVIYSLIIDQPLPRQLEEGYCRQDWTTSLALRLGYTNDSNILRRYLGPQESPFPKMFIKVYQDLAYGITLKSPID